MLIHQNLFTMIKLVIFDLGETLIFYNGLALDWSSHYEKVLRAVCKMLSIELDDIKIKQIISILYKYNTRVNPRTNEVSANQIFNEALSSANIDAGYLNSFIKEFFKYFQRKTEPEETAVELLTYLKESKVNTAVLTDVPYGMPKELVMEYLKPLHKHLDAVLTSVEVGYRKPLALGLQMLLEKFNCKNSETIYIGNEKKDIELAKGVGVFSVLMNANKETLDWGQDKTISKLIELREFITD